ncbi:MAG: hypothetical protein AAFO82_09450, partial [Bacteroidota bacterium]
MKKLHNRVNNDELKQLMLQKNEERVTLSFYQYAHISDAALFRNQFYEGLQKLEVFGRIYIAKEGINGQISVPANRLEELRIYLYSIDFLEG